MKLALAVVLLLAACGDNGSPAPADALDGDAIVNSFDQPLGAACDYDQAHLCAHGAHVCVENFCRQTCALNPACPDGFKAHFGTWEDHDICVCVPQ